MWRSAAKDNLRPSEKGISELNHTPHVTAVYASCSALLPPHATLATRRLARPYLDRTCTGRSRQLSWRLPFARPTKSSTPQHHAGAACLVQPPAKLRRGTPCRRRDAHAIECARAAAAPARADHHRRDLTQYCGMTLSCPRIAGECAILGEIAGQ